MFWAPLPHRGVIAVSGADRKNFLQGLITQDIFKLAADCALYSAFLTPQGKYLFDFFILENGDTIYFECDKDILAEFLKRLSAYKLRLNVILEDASEKFTPLAVVGQGVCPAFDLPIQAGRARTLEKSFIFVDPRLSDLGVRLLLVATKEVPHHLPEGSFSDYDIHRLQLGIPEGRRDLIPEKAILLENGFEELNGINWEKGCYLGQELTARTYYRGLIRKRLLPVEIVGPPLPFGTALLDSSGCEMGEMRSSNGAYGLAMIRLESFFALQEQGGFYQDKGEKTCLKPYLAAWMRMTPPPSS